MAKKSQKLGCHHAAVLSYAPTWLPQKHIKGTAGDVDTSRWCKRSVSEDA